MLREVTNKISMGGRLPPILDMKIMGGAADEVLVNLSAANMLIRRELNFFGDFIADSCGNIIAISADSDISWNDPVSILSSVCSCTHVFQGSLLSD